MEMTRRDFVAAATAAMLLHPTATMQAATNFVPTRLKREDCFFGLHFDLHPTANDKDLGRDLTEAMVGRLLDHVRPDFVQYDSKGHPGYLGFPSASGMSAPGIVQDSLAIWRRVTAAHGVALYNHFSGVWDGLACSKHPEWARVDADGKPHAMETSLFGPYEQDLMISELTEAATKYDLDGTWVDGDCWAVEPDYCEAARKLFHEKTGIDVLPRKLGDKGWNEFLDMQREQFRRYVAMYVEAVHRARPGYQITSNWMYSTFMPERPSLRLDFLSGDIAGHAPLRIARLQARYLACCSKPWDLMSWGFEYGDQYGGSNKPAVELEQEAAIVTAQGGAYNIYYVPTRSGWFDDRIINMAAEVGNFCRRRQQWSHRSETVPEVGVLFSGHTLYRTAGRVFGAWNTAESPAHGALEMLLSCGYSADIIPDWQAGEVVQRYPMIVVPDWKDIGEEVAAVLVRYVAEGGKLLLWGAENAVLLGPAFHLRFAGPIQDGSYFVAGESGFADVIGRWIEIDVPPSDVALNAYCEPDTRKGTMPLAVRVQHGKGRLMVSPGPIATVYGNAGSYLLRAAMRGVLREMHEPMVKLDAEYPSLEIVLRKKNAQLLIHLIETEGMPVTSEFRHPGIVARTGPIVLRIRLETKPTQVLLEPEGTSLAGKYEAGEWTGTLPGLHIHSMLRIPGVRLPNDAAHSVSELRGSSLSMETS